MARVSYEFKRFDSADAYVRGTMLRWLIDYINSEKFLIHDQTILDFIMCHFTETEISSIYLKSAEALLLNSPVAATELIDDEGDLNSKAYGDLINSLTAKWHSKRTVTSRKLIIKQLTKLLKTHQSLIQVDSFPKKLDELATVFRLSETEKKAIIFFFARMVDSEFNELSSQGSRYDKSNKKLFEQFIRLTNTPRSEGVKIFNHHGLLRKFKIIDQDFDLNYDIHEFLNDMMTKPIFSELYSQFDGSALPLEVHNVKQNDIEMIRAIITNREPEHGINILLYGVPGTGKTEFCRSLANELKSQLYEINSTENSESSKGDVFNRYVAFYLCQNSIPRDNAIILIDEADELLNSSSNGLFAMFGADSRNSEKNKINELLDNTKSVNIWITNYSSAIDESTRRRFDYSVEFIKFGFTQRLNTWQTAVQKYHLQQYFTAEDLNRLAKEFNLNAGGIDIALRNFRRLPEPKRQINTLLELIVRHLELMEPGYAKQSKLKPVKNYRLDGLNIKGEQDINDAMEIVTEFSRFMATPEYQNSEIRNMNMLLYGAPGTGKTEFVKYLAQQTGRELVMKSCSDFLNMYVGETERIIRQLFSEAENDGAILFIDEADGLFFDRNNSMRSFETSRVNELLVCMENFSGILICSTNFKKNMDFASLRRFNLKFEFDYLDNNGKLIFYNNFFAKLTGQLNQIEGQQQLAAINNLTPGDFKAVYNRYAFFRQTKLSPQILLNALQNEVEHKQGKVASQIGFAK
jgi:AAA+ superfamily predicted ATPase